MAKIKLKVCGMRDAENIKNLVENCGPSLDYLGFIFYENSSRYALLHGKDALMQGMVLIPAHIKKVGVFVNALEQEVLDITADFKLEVLQLHGDESPRYIAELKNKLPADIEIIKVLSVQPTANASISTNELSRIFLPLREYSKCADYILLDTKAQARGGNGISFDWNILDAYEANVDLPFFLSGGINMDSVAELSRLRTKNKSLYGIDINSRFELEPAIKDCDKIMQFIQKMDESNE